MKRIRLVLIALLVSPVAAVWAAAPTVGAEGCRFVLGFETLHNAIPGIVGECRDNEHYNPQNGDALQNTAKGLLVWRKADNFTAFTDGHRTWVNGPYGIQQRLNVERFEWEGDFAPQTNTSAQLDSYSAALEYLDFAKRQDADFTSAHSLELATEKLVLPFWDAGPESGVGKRIIESFDMVEASYVRLLSNYRAYPNVPTSYRSLHNLAISVIEVNIDGTRLFRQSFKTRDMNLFRQAYTKMGESASLLSQLVYALGSTQ